MVGSAYVKQRIIAVAVEDHFAITGRYDGNGSLGCAICGQIVGAVKRGGAIDRCIIGVLITVVLIGPCMHDDLVAGPHPRPARGCPVSAGAPVIVSAHESFKGRLLFRTRIAMRIDMEFPTARVGFRFGAGAHRGKPFRVTHYTVGITDTELHFIPGVWIKV